LLCGHVWPRHFLPVSGSSLASPPDQGVNQGMATASHRARFPDTLPPLGDMPSEAKAGGEKKIVESVQRENRSEPLHEGKGLPIEIKRFIVESFACFQDVGSIQRELVKRFGLSLDARWIAKYDARRATAQLGRGLRAYYDQCRKAYVEGVAEVAIAHQAHRLRLLSRVVDKATTSRDYGNAIKGLELAAKEMGGVLSGQHVVRHEGTIGHVHATVEEARAEITARLTQVVEGGLLLAAPSPTEEGGA